MSEPCGWPTCRCSPFCDKPPTPSLIGIDGWVAILRAAITCQHGNTSGACSECRNGIDPTTGDVA